MAFRIFKYTSEEMLGKEEAKLKTKIELTEGKLKNKKITSRAKEIYQEHIAEAQARLRKVRQEFALRKSAKKSAPAAKR